MLLVCEHAQLSAHADCLLCVHTSVCSCVVLVLENNLYESTYTHYVHALCMLFESCDFVLIDLSFAKQFCLGVSLCMC